MEINGSVVVVTGAGAGLGRATVERFARLGAKVVAVDLDPTGAGLPEGAIAAAADVRSPTQLDVAFGRAVETFGRLDALVHCAGVASGLRILDRDPESASQRFRDVVDVNLVGTFNALCCAARLMVTNASRADGGRGVIVTTASIAALEGQQGQVAYSGTKAGVIGMLLPAARELAEHGIRCVAISPGAFATRLTTGLPDWLQDRLVGNMAYPRRLGRPEEFAELACAIVGNEMLNGEVVRLDGGARLPAL